MLESATVVIRSSKALAVIAVVSCLQSVTHAEPLSVCEAAEAAKTDPKMSPEHRRHYAEAAKENGCYDAPPPKEVYYKRGASNEEFERTRARCLMQAEIARSNSNEPALLKVGTLFTVFRACMRAEGWVLVRE